MPAAHDVPVPHFRGTPGGAHAGRGSYVTGLPADRCVLLEEGAPQEVGHVEAPGARSGLDLAVAIDISGSVAPVIPRLKTRTAEVVESLANVSGSEAYQADEPEKLDAALQMFRRMSAALTFSATRR